MISTQVSLDNLLASQLKEYVRDVSFEKAKELLSSGDYAKNHSLLIRSSQNNRITIVRALTDGKGIKSVEEFIFTVLRSKNPAARDGLKFVRQIDTGKYASHMIVYSASTFVKLLAMMEETERRILYAQYGKNPDQLGKLGFDLQTAHSPL